MRLLNRLHLLPSPVSGTLFAEVENNLSGFRLAAPVAVPEPSTYAMDLAGYTMFRRRRAR